MDLVFIIFRSAPFSAAPNEFVNIFNSAQAAYDVAFELKGEEDYAHRYVEIRAYRPKRSTNKIIGCVASTTVYSNGFLSDVTHPAFSDVATEYRAR